MSDEELLKNILITKEIVPESTQELTDRFIRITKLIEEYEQKEQRLDDLESERDDLQNMVERAKQSIEATNQILNEDY